MSWAKLERAVLGAARVAFNNPKLRLKDIQEWSTGEVKPHPGEVVCYVPDTGAFVVVKAGMDKRKTHASP